MISRRSCDGVRAPIPASVRACRHAVNCGAIKAQRASDKSDGYGSRVVIPPCCTRCIRW